MPGLAWSGSPDRQNALRANKLLHPAFAANDAQVARAQDYLNSKGIAYTVTASDVDKALAAGYTADSLVAKANELLDRAKSDPEGAKNETVSILNALGVSVSDAKVTVNLSLIHI